MTPRTSTPETRLEHSRLDTVLDFAEPVTPVLDITSDILSAAGVVVPGLTAAAELVKQLVGALDGLSQNREQARAIRSELDYLIPAVKRSLSRRSSESLSDYQQSIANVEQ